MRKVHKYLLATLLVLAVVLLSALLFVGSRSDEWIRQRIISSLQATYPISVEIGRVDVQWRQRRLVLENFVIRSRLYSTRNPVFRVERLVAQFDYLDLYPFTWRSIRVNEIDALRPELWIQRDPNGKLNLSNLFILERKGAEEFSLFDLAIGHVALSGGMVHYLDHDLPIQTDGRNLEIGIQFDRHRRAYVGSIRLPESEMAFADLQIRQARGTVRFEYQENALNFPEISLRSDVGDISASGGIGDLKEIRYRFDVRATLRTEKLPPKRVGVLEPAGTVTVQGVLAGTHEDFALKAQLAAAQLRLYGIPLERIAARMNWTPRALNLDPLQGTAFSGGFRGSLSLAVDSSGRSQLETTISDADLVQVLRRFPIIRVHASGTIKAAGRWSWPGLDFQSAGGQGRGSVQGVLHAARGEDRARFPDLPFTAQSDFAQSGRSVTLSNAAAQTSHSQARFSGRAGFDGVYRFDANVTTRDAGEILRAASALGVVTADGMARSGLEFLGGAGFDGTLAGRRGHIEITGPARLDRLRLQGVDLGRFAGKIQYATGALRVADGSLIKNGSSVAFDMSVPTSNPAAMPVGMSIQARVRNGEIRDFLKAASLSYPFSGILNGTLDLQVVARDDIRGSGQIEVQKPGLGAESADFLKTRFSFDGATVKTSELLVRKAGGSVAGDFSYNVRTGFITADLTGRDYPLGALPGQQLKDFQLAGVVQFRLRGSGTLQTPTFTLEATTPRLLVRDEALDHVVLSARGEDGKVRFTLESGYRGQRFKSEGSLDVTSAYEVNASLDLKDQPIRPYLELLPFQNIPELDGTVSGKIEVRGPLTDLKRLRVVANLTSAQLRFQNITVRNRDPLRLEYDGTVVRVGRTVWIGPGTELAVEGHVPVDERGRIDLRLNGTANLAIVASLFPGAIASGQVALNTYITGTFTEPRIAGQADLKKGFLHQAGLPSSISNAEGTLRFTAQQISIENFTAKTAYGSIRVEGGVFLEGLAPARWRINISGSGLRINYPLDVKAVIDVDLDWLRSTRSQLLTGVVYVSSAEYTKDLDIADALIQYSNYKGLPPRSGLGSEDLDLDIDIEGYQSLRIDNNLANVVASADLNLRGTRDNPILLGRILVDSGELRLQSSDYEITRGSVSFSDTRKITPVVNFEAQTNNREYTLMVTVRGPIERMTTNFRSDPPLPTAEIVTMLALPERGRGQSGLQAEAGKTLALSGASALLGRGLASRIQTRTSRLFGFDKFAIDPFLERGDVNSPLITIGRNITKDLSVTYSTTLSSPREVVVIEYSLKSWATLVATRNEDGSFGLDLKLRKRF